MVCRNADHPRVRATEPGRVRPRPAPEAPVVVFPTIQFAVFFPIVLALSWALMPRQHVWKPFMLAASYLFYSAASATFCLLLAGVTLGNQAAAQLVHRTDDERRRRLIVGIAVALDLATLGVFKYYGF